MIVQFTSTSIFIRPSKFLYNESNRQGRGVFVDILVADDSKTNLSLITASLQKLGHRAIPATSGEEAIEFFLKERPDLIILDVVMNGMDGFECAKKLREIDSEDWIPIIFLSASVDDNSIAKGIDAGGDDYLTKPFSEITLAAKIKAMQRISDMRQKLFETTQQLYLQSSTDSLTGVYNRFQFDRSVKEILAAADRFHHLSALLFIDLDNFKNVNDSFGHHIGDLLLIEVAKRLKSCLRGNDFIARIGGDEFAIILNGIPSNEEAGEIAQNIINSVSASYELEGNHVRVGASVGIAIYPQSGITIVNFVQSADIAMYHAKSLGRNNYQYFSDELYGKYKQQISLEHALKFAMERNELYLTYQPIFNLKTEELVGLETLLCWDHPTYGIVPPTIFIAIAEEIGLMSPIGNWVLRTACEQANKWSLHRFKKFKFAINLSSRQLLQEHFFSFIKDIMKETHMTPEILELELTESTVMSYTTGPFRETIKKLHDLGISISIDDFGTGYSSLTRLRHLPVSTLKIDQTFVQDTVSNPNSAIIVNCLIALGKNLGLNVIAEGIETEEQYKFLITKGCPQGQGFFLSKPMRTEQMTEFLKEASTSGMLYRRENSGNEK